jgi:hypothetical protein
LRVVLTGVPRRGERRRRELRGRLDLEVPPNPFRAGLLAVDHGDHRGEAQRVQVLSDRAHGRSSWCPSSVV